MLLSREVIILNVDDCAKLSKYFL